MTRTAENPQTAPPAATAAPQAAASSVEQSLNWLKGKLTCPFCGTVTDRPDEACARCGMHDTTANRDATKARIGPWYVLQSRNPAAPGMTYATLMLLVKKGLVTARSIVRGPTTHQLWAFAVNVRGLSREFGVCWWCARGVEKSALSCSACGQSQKPPASAEDLVERPGQETRADTGLADEMEANEGAARVSPGAMDIVLPTPGDLRRVPAGPIAPQRSTVDEISANDLEPKSRPAAGRILSEEQLHSPARRMIHYPRESPWRRIRQGIGVLLLTTAIVLGFAMMLFPDFRRTSLYWANDTFAPLMQKWRAWGDSTRPLSNTEAPLVNPDGTVVDVKPKIEQHPKPGYVPRRAPAPVSPAPPVVDPVSPDRSPPTPARRAAAELLDEMVTQSLVRNLSDAARVSEANGDYKSALSSYEQIQAVPQRFWPDDLQQRIDAARAKVANP